MMPGRPSVPCNDGGVNKRSQPVFLHFGLRFGLQLRRKIEGVVKRHALRAECGRLGRKRLRRRRLLSGNIARGHRALLDRPHRLACNAIEHECEAFLGELHDGVDLFSVDRDGRQHRRRRQIVIPQAVMNDLEVPFARAGIGVQAHQRFAEQIVTGTIAAIEIVARRAHREIHQAAALIQRERRPYVGVAGEFPGIVAPGIVAEFARLRNSVEAPDALAGARIEGAHVARRIVLIRSTGRPRRFRRSPGPCRPLAARFRCSAFC